MSGETVGLPALVFLVGPSGAGKTSWAEEHFAVGEVVSSDRLREAVGRGQSDLDASADAFDLMREIVKRRLGRGLTVVVDTLGLDPDLRGEMREAALAAGLPAVAVLFDTEPKLCRQRNRQKGIPIPASALAGQIRRYRDQRAIVAAEPWTQVLSVDQVAAVSDRPADARTEAARTPGGFGLVLSHYPWPEGEISSRLAEVAGWAEEVGFTSLWVMDHLIQIPQVGRRWEPMLESLTTLAWLAGRTTEIELGPLVANASLRNPAHLAKIVATLDVISGGRARCGLGAGWWESELVAYGIRLPPVAERMERLEDALRLLPIMWGPGKTDFFGHHIEVRGAECYPRPLHRIPVLVGGQGPERTLRLAALHADAVNLRGGIDQVSAGVASLYRHCRAVERDPADIEVTHLSWPLVAANRRELAGLAERYPRGVPATITDQVGHLSRLRETGVDTFLFAPVDLAEGEEAIGRLAPIVEKLS